MTSKEVKTDSYRTYSNAEMKKKHIGKIGKNYFDESPFVLILPSPILLFVFRYLFLALVWSAWLKSFLSFHAVRLMIYN